MVEGASRLRFAHLRLNDSPDEAMLDLIEWHDVPTEGRAPADLIHPGLCRFSILTDDIQGEYDRLSARASSSSTPRRRSWTPTA